MSYQVSKSSHRSIVDRSVKEFTEFSHSEGGKRFPDKYTQPRTEVLNPLNVKTCPGVVVGLLSDPGEVQKEVVYISGYVRVSEDIRGPYLILKTFQRSPIKEGILKKIQRSV